MKKLVGWIATAVVVAIVAFVFYKKVVSKNDMRTSDTGYTFTVNGVRFEMIKVEGGTFQMGATSEQTGLEEFDESPVHRVTLSTYYIGETEVTQELWMAVMGSNPSCYVGDNLPVEQVSWEDCQIFLRALNAKTGKHFRLPTEAEWEYAARGGKKSHDYIYSGSNTIERVAWYERNSSKIQAVKTKSANELGLYDMSGNVYEWCQDWYGPYTSSSQTNPTGTKSGVLRTRRGGCWYCDACYSRVSNRGYGESILRIGNLGFRLAL